VTYRLTYLVHPSVLESSASLRLDLDFPADETCNVPEGRHVSKCGAQSDPAYCLRQTLFEAVHVAGMLARPSIQAVVLDPTDDMYVVVEDYPACPFMQTGGVLVALAGRSVIWGSDALEAWPCTPLQAHGGMKTAAGGARQALRRLSILGGYGCLLVSVRGSETGGNVRACVCVAVAAVRSKKVYGTVLC
jgi:hypothetical protein